MPTPAERMEARLQWPLLIAALLIVPVLAIEQSAGRGDLRDIAIALNWLSWSAFVAEAVLMLRVVDDRGRWLREHPLEVAVILLTPPFLPASLQAARGFRLLRLLRLLRAAILIRRMLSTEGVRDAGVLALLTILGGGAAYAALEKTTTSGETLSTWDGVWWAITTVTTVGYGDSYPVTTGGRLVAILVMVVGIGFVAILTAATAERFVSARRVAESEREDLGAKLDAIALRLDAIERGTRPDPPPPRGTLG